MNVREFAENEIQRIILFREYWQKENAKDQDRYPSEMEEVDWIENYTSFVDKE